MFLLSQISGISLNRELRQTVQFEVGLIHFYCISRSFFTATVPLSRRGGGEGHAPGRSRCLDLLPTERDTATMVHDLYRCCSISINMGSIDWTDLQACAPKTMAGDEIVYRKMGRYLLSLQLLLLLRRTTSPSPSFYPFCPSSSSPREAHIFLLAENPEIRRSL
jgi:hypothetical protein